MSPPPGCAYARDQGGKTWIDPKPINPDMFHTLLMLLSLMLLVSGCGNEPTRTDEGWPPPTTSGTATSRGAGDGHLRGMAHTYALTFVGFSQPEIYLIEEQLTVFSGYQSYRPLRIQGRHAEYEYITHREPDQLRRDLQKMLWTMKLEATLDFHGNRYHLEKIAHRQERSGQTRPEW